LGNLFPYTTFKILVFIFRIAYLDQLFSKESQNRAFIARCHPLICVKHNKYKSLSICLEELSFDFAYIQGSEMLSLK